MLAAVSALGIACSLSLLFWLWYGSRLFPADCPVTVTLSAEGRGERAEHCVRGLCWLRAAGLLRGAVWIQDAGLTAEGRARLLALIAQRPGIRLSPPPGY